MPFKTAVQARWNAVRSWRPDREKRWHYVFMLFSWACFIFACWRTWQVVYGRMYYLLDSDMSSELVLSHLLRQEHKNRYAGLVLLYRAAGVQHPLGLYPAVFPV